MSRSIPAEIITQLESAEITPYHLVQMKINNVYYRFTNCEIPITTSVETSSGTFLPRSFSFDDISYSTGDIVDAMKIKFDDIDAILKAVFIENVIVEQEFMIWLILLDSNNQEIEKTRLFQGNMNEFNIDEASLDLTITSIFARWAQQGYGKHSALCRWKKFKSTECAYNGVESACDRTFARCTQLSNTVNFGGFKYIPAMEDLIVFWGPTPKQAEYWRSHKDPPKRKF